MVAEPRRSPGTIVKVREIKLAAVSAAFRRLGRLKRSHRQASCRSPRRTWDCTRTRCGDFRDCRGRRRRAPWPKLLVLYHTPGVLRSIMPLIEGSCTTREDPWDWRRGRRPRRAYPRRRKVAATTPFPLRRLALCSRCRLLLLRRRRR